MGIVQRQGIKNTVVTYAGIIIGFVNLIIVQPHLLTPEEVGLTRVLFSLSSLLSVFLPLGIGNITLRYFPYFRDRENRHHGFFGLVILFPLAGFAAVSAVLWTFHDFFTGLYETESPLLAEYFNYVFPLCFLLGLNAVLNIYAFSLFRTTVPSLLNDVFSRLLTIVVIGLYYAGILDLERFVLFSVLVYAAQLLLLLTYIFAVDRPGLRIDVGSLRRQGMGGMLEYGAWLSLASIASLGIRYLDAIMLAHYRPLAVAGVYAVAVFIPAIIEAPINALEKIANAKIANALATDNRKEIEEIYFRSSRYMLLLGGLLFAGININIDTLLTFLPEAYHGGGNVVLIISIGTMFHMASGANSAILFASKHYKYGVLMLLCLIVAAFFANILLIPRYGMEGAAAATCIAAFLYSFMRYIFILQKFHLQPYDTRTLLIVMLIAASFGINHLLPALGDRIADILYRSVVILLFYAAGTRVLNIVPEFHRYLGGRGSS